MSLADGVDTGMGENGGWGGDRCDYEPATAGGEVRPSLTDQGKRDLMRRWAKTVWIAAYSQDEETAALGEENWESEIAWLWDDERRSELLTLCALNAFAMGVALGTQIDRTADGKLDESDFNAVMMRVADAHVALDKVMYAEFATLEANR